MAAEFRVAVIGAGAAGLAAAWRLARSGARVTVLERGDVPGGLLRTETMEGAQVDVGVQLVSSTHSALRSLLVEVGTRDALRRSPGRDALWRRGRAHAITYGSIASMAASGALPTTLKLKLAARYLPYLRTRAARLDANDPAANGGAGLDVESIGDWGRRELGDDFVELLVYPLLAAYYGATPERTSAPLYHALARVGMDVSVMAAAAGFGGVARAIMSAVESHGGRFVPGAAVQAVDVSADRVRIMRAGASGVSGAEGVSGAARGAPSSGDNASGAHGADDARRSGDELYDAAVIATAPNVAADLLGTAHPAAVTWLRPVAVRSTFSLALRMDRPFPGDYFGLSFPRGAAPGDTVAALCVQSRKLRGMVPAGGDALVALPAPAAAVSLMDGSDDDIVATMLAALEVAVRGITKRVVGARVHRYPDGCVLFEPGHLKRLAATSAALLPSRLALAGAYMVAPTVEGAVRSGERAAARVGEALGLMQV